MKYKQYKGVIERKYKKSLKKVMYEICVEKGLNAVEGAKELGLAKEIFIYWRHYYRYDENQLLFDEIVKDLKPQKKRDTDEINDIDIKRPLSFDQEESIRGFEELIIRMIEYYQDVQEESEGLSKETGKLPLYEFSLDLVKSYQEGTLKKEVKNCIINK